MLVDVATGAEVGDGDPPLRERRHRRAAAGAGRRRRARARLGAPGPGRLHRGVPARPFPPTARRVRGRARRRHRDRASTSPPARCSRRPPTARRSAASPSFAASRTPGSSSGSITPRSPRRTGSTPSPPRAASRGSPATAAGSRRSGSSRRPSRSSTRRPRVYRAADRLIEAADWVVWQLTGVETRNTCTAGYKAIWSKRDGLPGAGVLRRARPAFGVGRRRQDVAAASCRSASAPGELTDRGGGLDRPAAGTPVAVANVDAHVSVPAAASSSPARWSRSWARARATSSSATRLGAGRGDVRRRRGRGHPGLVRLRGRPVGCRRHLRLVRRSRRRRPRSTSARGATESALHEVLEREAAGLRPGESGPAGARLVERQPVDPRRRRAERPARRGDAGDATAPTIYRALLEATAFGTRVIIDAFETAGVAVERDRRVRRAARSGTSSSCRSTPTSRAGRSTSRRRRRRRRSGSAMYGAVAAGAAAGGYDSIADAATALVRPHVRTFRPSRDAGAVYDELFVDYMALHDHFGRGGNDVMRRLRSISARQTRSASAATRA